MLSKKRILIASTLKPIDDVRSYRKIGVSLAKTNKYEINILGFGSKISDATQNIHFIPLGTFKRLSFKRFFLPFTILGKILKLKPSILIIETHELLIAGVIYKYFLPRGKLVYDIRENYHTNLRTQKIYSNILSKLMAIWIRQKEQLSQHKVDLNVLAETSYLQELAFLKKDRCVVLQNKALPHYPQKEVHSAKVKKLIFTGNLSENSGVLRAISLVELLAKEEPEIELLIVGHSPSEHFSKILNQRVHATPNVELLGGQAMVSHDVIAAKVMCADLGIVAYDLNPSNRFCMPTKVFEYLAMRLPFICEKGTGWAKYAQQFNMAFTTDFKEINISTINKWYDSIDYTYNNNLNFWGSEEEKLLDCIDQLTI